METELEAALDLLRRLPPQNIEKNVENLVELYPDLCEPLLSAVDQPLKVAYDSLSGKQYLLSDYNRDGDSFRSPWSNVYEPALEEGVLPSNRLRRLEVEANEAFEKYLTLYFGSGISSVYLWDTNHGFAAAVLLKKGGNAESSIESCWDSIHVVDIQEKANGRSAHYKLTSTLLLRLKTSKSVSGSMNLGGSISRQIESDLPTLEPMSHIVNVGRIIENHENKLRSNMNEIYFGKTKDVLNSLRSVIPLDVLEERRSFCSDITQVVGSRTSKVVENSEHEGYQNRTNDKEKRYQLTLTFTDKLNECIHRYFIA